MGRSGRETLTMESNDTQGNYTREKGFFVSRFSSFLLLVLFCASLIATGVIVYYFSNNDADMAPVHYDVSKHTGVNSLASSKPLTSAPPKSKKVMDVRLPTDIRPLHYHVRLIPYINGNFSIRGYVKMDFEVVKPTPKVTLHIRGIVTKNDTVKVMPKSSGDTNALKISKHVYDKDREFYIVEMMQDLKSGQIYSIEMDFEGYLNKDLSGFYRSSYKDKQGNTRWLAATQFQPTDARKAFPCMDEPGLKASFTVELARQTNMTSISNMPLEKTEPMEGNPGWVWDKFQKSVNMSTYLVAFVVSDFKYLESDMPSKYKFKVWAREEALPQAQYAIEKGPPASKYFEEYFNVPFPLPKQDMVALPDFSAGAMENWGLITYRETAMLYDPHSSMAIDKQYLASVIVHELAHQWFGNLVTPQWWTDLWLNEGFASYMEYIGTNKIEPSFKMMELFVTEDLQSVLSLDALETSHPINIPVHHPDEINEIFDKISYLKGSSIIRMMSHFLTEDTFRKGLSNYLKGLAYNSAIQDDLWRYLTEQAHADGTLPHDFQVKTIMDTWTLQMGFPVITVTKKPDNTATLTQDRFLLVQNKTSTSSSHDYKWWVPITHTSKNNPDFTTTRPKLWMRPEESTKEVQGIPFDQWTVLNVQQTGYYRVNYDENNWKMIIDQLLADHTRISTVNRAQIIDDSMGLARAGLLSYETAFKILSYLKNEQEYVPWKAALRSLGFIRTMFSHSGGYGALKQFVLSIILPMYNKIGFDDKVTDPHLDQLMRSRILSTACALDYKPCIDQSLKLFEMWKANPQNSSFISPNLKGFVYCTAISKGSEDDWNFAWDRYQESNVGVEKRTLLSAMGCTEQIWIMNEYLNRAITDGSGVRKQDARTVIGSVAGSEHGRSVAWNFIKDKWPQITSYFGSVSFTLNGIIKSTTSALNTKNQLSELKEFRSKYEGQFGSAARAMDQAVENAENNLQWMEDNYQLIYDWLRQNNFKNFV